MNDEQLVAGLEAKEALLEADHIKAEAEVQRAQARSREIANALSSLRNTLEYFQRTSAPGAMGRAVVDAKKDEEGEVGEGGAFTGQRKRLPPGYAHEVVREAYDSDPRFYHALEFQEILKRRISEDFPESPDLKASPSTINNVTRSMWESGEFARAIYDSHSNFHFYGSSDLTVLNSDGTRSFAATDYEPRPEFLRDVKNLTPEFVLSQKDPSAREGTPGQASLL